MTGVGAGGLAPGTGVGLVLGTGGVLVPEKEGEEAGRGSVAASAEGLVPGTGVETAGETAGGRGPARGTVETGPGLPSEGGRGSDKRDGTENAELSVRPVKDDDVRFGH